ncbi:uncharacterized protein LOC131174020 [Hevea brasiliensis]|uniref:uncharacterized protein LOC131174020 n=1 Tax=Hevea brasiliensis TaxID=3981 RepID=UPI0025D9B6CB|nr:uncharacterized protein LOC131174020 [Hevea brasiliensis]
MYFNGAVNLSGSGIGAVLISPDGKHFPVAVRLRFKCTNNVAEYETCVSGLQAAIEMKFADALATLAVMTQMEEGQKAQLLQINLRDELTYYLMMDEEIDGKPWYHDIQQYIKTREYPPGANKNERRMIRRLALGYFPSGEIMYRRNFNGELLRCVDANEAKRILFETHEGNCATHANGHMMAKQILQ